MPEVVRAEVRQLMLLEIGPHVLGGIEFGSVGRQIESFDAALESPQIILYDSAAMPGQAVPNQQDGVGDLFGQMADEIEHLLLAHVALVQAEVELRSEERRVG